MIQKFDRNQPRAPAGTPQGGQWIAMHNFPPGSWQASEAEKLHKVADEQGLKALVDTYAPKWLRPYKYRLMAAMSGLPLPPGHTGNIGEKYKHLVQAKYEKLLEQAVKAATTDDSMLSASYLAKLQNEYTQHTPSKQYKQALLNVLQTSHPAQELHPSEKVPRGSTVDEGALAAQEAEIKAVGGGEEMAGLVGTGMSVEQAAQQMGLADTMPGSFGGPKVVNIPPLPKYYQDDSGELGSPIKVGGTVEAKLKAMQSLAMAGDLAGLKAFGAMASTVAAYKTKLIAALEGAGVTQSVKPGTVETMAMPGKPPTPLITPPDVPVQHGTSGWAKTVQNKILQLQTASASSDPINNILKVSMLPPGKTPAKLTAFRDALLKYHNQLLDVTGKAQVAEGVAPPVAKPKAAPAAAGVAAPVQAVAAAAPKTPLPEPPVANTTKYTPEQVALYNTKLQQLKDAALGPNPFVAIDKIQGMSSSIQAYKTALLNWIESNTVMPDAMVGETYSTYKVIAEHAVPLPPQFALASHEQMKKTSGPYRQALPYEQQSAVSYYQGSGYHALNAHRFNPSAKLPANHVHLDKALYGHQVDRDLRVIRNIGSTALAKIAKSLKGRIIEDPAYQSTSLHGHFGSDRNVRWVMNVPKGTRGLYLFGSGGSNYEEELLLPRNTRMAVHDVTKDGTKTVIYASVLPHHQQPSIPHP